MCQIYHSNARTNYHIREIIQQSDLANVKLANRYSINIQTVSNSVTERHRFILRHRRPFFSVKKAWIDVNASDGFIKEIIGL
jgi:hypothetical protein